MFKSFFGRIENVIFASFDCQMKNLIKKEITLLELKSSILFSFLFFVFFSSGQSFTPITQNITNNFYFAEISEANNVAIIGGTFVSKSLDGGFTWNQMPLGNQGIPWQTYDFIGGIIVNSTTYILIGKDFLNNKSKIIRTTNGGATWTNMLETPTGSNSFFTHIVSNGGVIIVGAKDGIYRSTNQGLTWSFVAVNTGYINSINYNTSTNKFLVNYSPTGVFRESNDNGLTWSFITLTSTLATYSHISNQNNNYLVTASSGGLKRWFTFNSANTPLDTIVSNSGIFTGTTMQSFLLPNGRIISRVANSGTLYNIDPSTNNAYLYNFNLQNPGGTYAEISFMDIDASYGLVVGEMGAVARINLSAFADFYLPATFSLTNGSCPGSTISGQATYLYADSTLWFYDGNFIANGTSLSYTTPSNFGTFDVVMQNWVEGSSTADTLQVSYLPPNPAPIYTASVFDTMPCFNQSAFLQVAYVSGPIIGSVVEVWQDDLLIYGPSPANSSGFNTSTNILGSIDTLYTIISYAQQCGTAYDTLVNVVYPGDDLSDNFTLLPNFDTICTGQVPVFQFVNASSAHTYSFSMTNSYYTFSWNTTAQGINNDTLIVNGPPLWATTFDVNTYYTLAVSDTNGCSQSSAPFDTITVSGPSSVFYAHSQNFYKNDTLILSNANIRSNRTWSAHPTGLNVQNFTDTVPIIVADTVGFFDIALKNQILFNCADSNSLTVQLCDTLLVEPNSLCWENNGGNYNNLVQVEMDKDGNLFELGVFKAYPTLGSGTPRPGYRITKRDQNGNLLWTKQAEMTQFNFYTDGVVIEAIDIDANGDVICAMWIQSTYSYSQGLISYSRISLTNEKRLYVLKLDGQTGNMIWVSDLTSSGLAFSNSANSNNWRVSDVIVTATRIHVGLTFRSGFYVASLDLLGNYLSSDFMYGLNIYCPNYHHIYSGSLGDDRESYRYLQLDELSTGEVICAAYYSGKPYHNNIPLTSLYALNGNALMLMKYTEQSGFYAFKKVIEGVSYNETTPNFVVDKNDNLTIAASWMYYPSYNIVHDTVQILDSIVISVGLPASVVGATFLFQVGSAYNLNWISRGNYSEITDLDIAKTSGEIFLAGKTAHNVGFGTGNVHRMIGDYGVYSEQYGVDPALWALKSVLVNTSDLYNFRFSNDGEPLSGRFYDVEPLIQNWQLSLQHRNILTPCGDMFMYVNRKNLAGIDSLFAVFDGGFLAMDSLKIQKFTMNCGPEICQYMEINQDTLYYCPSSDSLMLNITNLYNVDSVTYDLMDNGMFVNTHTVLMDTTFLQIVLPYSSSNFSVVVHSPIIDTIVLSSNGLIPMPVFTFDSIMCIGSQQTITTDSQNLQYMWMDTIGGQNLNFTANSIGLSFIPVLTTNSYNCFHLDTLTINVVNPVSPNFLTSYSVACDSQLIIPYNTTSFTSNTWTINGLSTTNLFSELNLNPGVNNAIVVLTDTIGCAITSTLTIDFVPAIAPTFLSVYNLLCSDTLIVGYNSTDYISSTWQINGTSTSNQFSNDNLNLGLNNPQVTLTDTNGCIQMYQLSIFLLANTIAPTFLSTYQIPCGDTLIIQYNSTDYIAETWWVNGVISTNNFSASNLNNGANSVAVNLVDINGCLNTFQISIFYCSNVGLEEKKPDLFTVTPNPTQGNVKFLFVKSLAKGASIKIFDIHGRIVDEFVPGEVTSVNYVLKAAQGTYYAVLENEGRRETVKLIIY